MLTRRAVLLASAALTAGAGAGGAVAAEAAAPTADNSIVLRDQSGSGAKHYPVRIGRPFVEGEIRGVPQAIVGGQRLPTQADVKTSWPDGSVRHAVLSFVVPHIPADGTVTVGFTEQPASPGEALTKAAMLDPVFDFDVSIKLISGGQERVVHARAMLEAGHYAAWAAGPVATTIVLADHTEARRYDVGFDDLRSFRPIFHATFWPGLGAVHVRVIGENCNTLTLQDLEYDVEVFGGFAAPRPIFAQAGVRHDLATRWSRSFWLRGAPEFRIGIDHNLAYLARTRAIPNYDTSLKLPARVIAGDFAHWQAARKDLFDPGLWQTYMPTTGGRDDIGHFPGYAVRWLYSGDWRHALIATGMADLAASWPLQVREGDPARRFDAAGRVGGLGRFPSIYGRPTLWLLDGRDRSRPADKITLHISPNRRKSDWANDGAHQPDPYSVVYLLTGDPFALEQLQLWAGVQAMSYNPGYRSPPAPPGAGIRDQIRGDAWVFRTRVSAAVLSPDGTPEKDYFIELVGQAIAYWEGMCRISDGHFAGTAMWRFGELQPAPGPLHLIGEQRDDIATAKYKRRITVTAMWQNYMLLFEIAHARECGLPTESLLSWHAKMLTGQFAEQPGYSPYNIGRYYTRLRDADGNYYQSWTATLAGYDSPQQPTSFGHDVGDGYPTYATAAAAVIVDLPGGADAYAWLRKNYYLPNRPSYALNPKWAIVPRP